MVISFRAFCLSVLFAVFQTTPARPADQHDDVDVVLQAALAAAQAEDCTRTLEIVDRQTEADGFSGLTDPARINFYYLGTVCAARKGKVELASRYAQAGTRIRGAPAALWQARFNLEWGAQRYADAVTTIEEMTDSNPAALGAMPVGTGILIDGTLKDEPALRRRVLKVFASPAYVPKQIGYSTDYFKREYALMLSDAGDNAQAAALVARIGDPTSLMRLSLDPRTRHMIAENFDARAAVERHMARMRELAAAHSELLKPLISVADDLIDLGEAREALATLQAVHPESAAENTFADRAGQLNWWWNSKGRAYALLGRYDDVVAAYTEGIRLTEHGLPNVSQRINLAGKQVRFGHPADALVTLGPIAAGKSRASSYGLMQFHGIHGCASFKAGKIGDAKSDLSYMLSHAADAPSALTSLELCMGDVAGAALSVSKQLATPDQRVDALLYLSDYAAPPPSYPPDPAEASRPALKSRADVQAAISKAGGIRHFNTPLL
jgi:tetratricopeptide (TPR) repeat protein